MAQGKHRGKGIYREKNVEDKDQLICLLANVLQARLERLCTI
jgi:hypothetical protein